MAQILTPQHAYIYNIIYISDTLQNLSSNQFRNHLRKIDAPYSYGIRIFHRGNLDRALLIGF